MHACGVVVEYNPFHNGHLYHLQKARELTNADCIIAVMSGSFLQRGEPAIIDKFHRTRAALAAGADIVIELPYAYAVQSSELFAKGAIFSLHELDVSSICFGSESGRIEPFLFIIDQLRENKHIFDETIRHFLKQGLSYPKANSEALQALGMTDFNMIQPNNILGFSYVKTIMNNHLPIKPFTIERIKNDYHEQEITNTIASATSIRKEIFSHQFTEKVKDAIPTFSLKQMIAYKNEANTLHSWSNYFPYLIYQIMSQSNEQLAEIHGMEEGLENRIKRAALAASSFNDFIGLVKTKRYTQARLQRIFLHILTNTKKKDINAFIKRKTVPYIRLLGMNENGQVYLNKHKKQLNIPLITNLNKEYESLTYLDEKATHIYYNIISTENRRKLLRQEFKLPIRMNNNKSKTIP